MKTLFRLSETRLQSGIPKYVRLQSNEIDWDDRLTAIIGARGVGKTTIMLQYLKERLPRNEESIYVSLDNMYFSKTTLFDFAEEFINNGGKHLFLDEVHKYTNWSVELKNIYDNFPDLRVTFTGSSALDIYKGDGDLSRRAVKYDLKGLSFREFLELEKGIKIDVYKLEDVLKNHVSIASKINKDLTIIPLFKEYLRHGYYPFYRENKKNFLLRLSNTLNQVIESDLPHVFAIDFQTISKMKELLGIISDSPPFKPNIVKLSERMNSSRMTILKSLDQLDKADVLNLLKQPAQGLNKLTKPEKIFFDNSNLLYSLSSINDNIGSVRETFFFNQLCAKYSVNYSKKGDFLVNNKFVFEVGGKNKTQKQISGVVNGYLALDDIIVGYKNAIPLWLFGFLY